MKLLTTFLSILFITSLFSQVEDKKYQIRTTIMGNKFEFAHCGVKNYAIYPNKIRVVNVDGETVRVELLTGYYPVNTTIMDTASGERLEYITSGTCCIKKSYFNDKAIIKEISLPIHVSFAFGTLVAPFKFQTKDFKIYPAGQLGFYLGPKIFLSKSHPEYYLTIPISGGFTQIPLNDLNSTNSVDIRSVFALSGISGLICSLGRDFQFGVLGGYDFFNADNAKFQRSWISVSIGFNFVRTKEPLSVI